MDMTSQKRQHEQISGDTKKKNVQLDHNSKIKFPSVQDETLKKEIMEEIKRREKRRKKLIALCFLLAVISLGYFGAYSYMGYRTQTLSNEWASLKQNSEKNSIEDNTVIVHKTSTQDAPEILPEYQSLFLKNQSLIGWIKMEDTNIDYPVMQTTNNDYYLTHNFDQQYDKNGSIFMDAGCDVINRSTNLIIYGHHMKSGNMFGQLDYYADETFYQKHPTFNFDTIYEKGIYQIIYVFRSQVYTEDTITFKYYQMIDINSELAFNSDMQAMSELSLYDTGVIPTYGNQFVTLSTCDHSETSEGRFVVVGMKIA